MTSKKSSLLIASSCARINPTTRPKPVTFELFLFYGTCFRNQDTKLVSTSFGATCEQHWWFTARLAGCYKRLSPAVYISVRRGTKHTTLITWNHILMEELLHHQGCTKNTHKWWDKLSTSTGEFMEFLNHQQYDYLSPHFNGQQSWNHPFQVTMSWISASV